MTKKIHNIDDIKRRVQDQIEFEQKEYLADLKDSQEQKSVIEGFSNSEIIDALRNNESGDANLFKKIFKDKMIYDHAEGLWYLWEGDYWQEDKIEEVLLAVEKVVEIYSRGIEYQTAQRIKAERSGQKDMAESHRQLIDNLAQRIRSLQALKRRRNVIVLSAAGKGSLGFTGEGWDSNEMLFACSNVLIDLTTGKSRAGKPIDLIKTVAPTKWISLDYKSPAWEQFLSVIFQDNLELIKYIQRLLGYSITGKSTEHLLPILWGQGRNGKGTMLEILQYVLGPLAGPIQAEMLLDQGRLKNSSSPTSDIVALRGKRLVWASETDAGRRLNDGKVKWLVGGDTLVGRPPFGRKEITFRPTHTLFLLTNHKPHIASDDYALWQRVHLIPFVLSFVDEPSADNERKRDPELPTKLRAEASGILSWLVRGCLEWQQLGLNPPLAVKQATREYRQDEDIIGHFIDDTCTRGDGQVQAGVLYKAYGEWCKENGYRPINGMRFGKAMRTVGGVECSKTSRLVMYHGLSLTEEWISRIL